jgi:hypothetical protein
MDPSPFIDRDLDHDAEVSIDSSAREAHGGRSFDSVAHLATEPDATRAVEMEAQFNTAFPSARS